MATQTSICNQALAMIGASRISSLTDDKESARLCSLFFEDTLDAVLRWHPWNCATARATLSPLSTTPAHGYDYEFQIPVLPWCLKVLSEINDYDFVVEGRKILSNEASLEILYIKRVTDVNELDPILREALAAWLAFKLTYPLTGSASLRDELGKQFMGMLSRAKAMDVREAASSAVEDGSWVTERA